MGVDLGYDGGGVRECGGGAGGEDALPDSGHVGGDAVHTVGVHTAQVGGDEALGNDLGIGWGDAIAG